MTASIPHSFIVDGWDFSPEQLMQPGEVAKAFDVDPKTVTRWAMAGRLAYIRTPAVSGTGHRRYSRQQVEHIMHGGAS